MNDANNAGSLLPCPFCKSRCVTATRDEHGWKIVECDDCGARGPCIDLDGDQYIDRWNALSTPNAPVEQREAIARLIDPQAFNVDPPTQKDSDGKASRRWCALARADAILAVRLDEAAIRADEREKCLNQVCESLFALADGWKAQPGKEETATAVSNAAVFICGKERAIAIRNGGKQP